MIDGKIFFDQSVKLLREHYENMQEITTAQGDDYITDCLVDYNYFKKYYKMMELDLCKQQALDADPKVIQQINVTRKLENISSIFFIIEEEKESILDFNKELLKYCKFILL